MQLKERILKFLTDAGIDTSKKWYLSRTFWINIIALAAFAVQSKYGFVVAPGDQLMVLGTINLIMRFVTGKELRK